MKKIAVTGGSGHLGAWVVRELVDSGYDVTNIDARPPKEPVCRTIAADVCDIGELYGAFAQYRPDAVVHLAAIPNPLGHTDEHIFKTNTMSAYNVFDAAARLGVKKVVAASSDSSYGVIFARKKFLHAYLPIDEELPQLPQDPYGLSKLINEKTAESFVRWNDMQIVCLRFCFIASPDSYARFPEFNNSPDCEAAPWKIPELWNYVDARDAARACRLAAEAEVLGFCAINIAAKDTSMNVKTAELVKKHYAGVKDLRGDFRGYSSLTSTQKAKRLLGWEALHSWRD